MVRCGILTQDFRPGLYYDAPLGLILEPLAFTCVATVCDWRPERTWKLSSKLRLCRRSFFHFYPRNWLNLDRVATG